MESKYNIRHYQEGDENQIVPLLILAFKTWPFYDITCSPIDHWKWRYLDNPKGSMLLEITHGEKIIATGHNSIYNLIINGQKLMGTYGTDACVHPDYQGKGLYGKIAKTMNQWKHEIGIKFHYFVTTNPRVINSTAQRASTPHLFPHRVKYLTKIDDIDMHLKMNEISQGYLWKLKHTLKQTLRSPPISINGKLEIKDIDVFDDRFNNFLEEINTKYGFIKERSQEYLNWRYLDPRGGSYKVKGAVEDGEVLGYSVLRINKIEPYHTGYFVDLLTLNRLNVAEALIQDGLDYFDENNVNQIVCQVIEEHPYEELFNRHGFSGGENSRMLFYGYYDSDEAILNTVTPSKFHFPFGALTGI